MRRVPRGLGFAEYEQRGSLVQASRVNLVLSRNAFFVGIAISLEAMLSGQPRQLRRQRSLDRASHTGRPKAVNYKQDGLAVAPRILNLDLQLLHRLNNSLARMGDVYLAHGISHKRMPHQRRC